MKTIKRSISLVLVLCMVLSLFTFTATAEPAEVPAVPTADTADGYSLDLRDYAGDWQYATNSGVGYWTLDNVVYCADPTIVGGDPVQLLRIYAPEAYMAEDENGDAAVTDNAVTSTSGVTYTAATAPIIYRNSSGGYGPSSRQNMSTELSGYIEEGYVVVTIQTRGKTTRADNGDYIGQFPVIMVDLKAGVRYLKANADVVPGNPERIVSAGHSSGGGVSAMLGASGNASVFDPYLEEIGAADTGDDIFITMASAPVTNVSTADASYEWYQYGATEYFLFNAMNQYSYDDDSGLTPFNSTGTQYYFELGGNTLGGTHEDELSEVLNDMYVEYIQGLGFDLTDDGHGGEYWDGFVQLHTDGLNDHIGRMSDEAAEAYVKGLANWEDWIAWDDESKTATITDFTGMLENYVPRKNMVLSIDTVNYLGNENDAFVSADGTREHFSPIARDALEYVLYEYDGTGWQGEALEGTVYTRYTNAKPSGGVVDEQGVWTEAHRTFTQEESLAYLESLYEAYDDGVTEESAYMLDVMSPSSYILEEEGFDDADISPYWRLRFGGTDGGVSIPEAWFMAQALEAYQPDVDVHIGIAWTYGHSFSEPFVEEFYAYIDEAMVENWEEPGETGLLAGAGVGVIDLEGYVDPDDPDMQVTENFTGEINDDPHARVLLFESTDKVAIVSIEMMHVPSAQVTELQQLVSEMTGTPVDNVWIHANHTLSTPHGTQGSSVQQAMWRNAVRTAVTEATEQAIASLQPAKTGVGTGELDINQNWNLYVEATDSYTYGPGGNGEYGESNKTMTVLRVDSLDDEPIGFLLSYGIKPNAMDMGGATTGSRVITADVPGYACNMLEDEFGVPAMFCTPGAGDQMMEIAYYYQIGEDGLPELVDEGVEKGLEYINKYGPMLGEAAIEVAKDITPDNTDVKVAAASGEFEAESARGGTATGPVNVIQIGDLAFVGFQEELTALTELELWAASPFENTLLMTFLNGDNRYMPNAQAYDDSSYETTRTNWAKGAAEEFVATSVELLEGLYDDGGEEAVEVSADDAIEGVHAIGFVDTDGAKLSAIAVEYNVDLTGAVVDLGAYEVTNYAIGVTPELGTDPGVATRAYVNDEPAISETGGTGSGSYVIIEVNTDYQLAMAVSTYRLAMIAGVTQTGTIEAGNTTVTPGTEEVANYTGSGNSRRVLDGTYTIQGTEVYELHTLEDGTAFYATDCFEEADGQLHDVELPYALYVPEDYSPDKSYAMVLHVHDAGTMGTDPMLTLTEAQGPINFASDEVQALAKAEGLDGIIVVAPQLETALRSTRDNWTTSRAVPATWQLVDHIVDAYSIDENRIYATGQSMGAMQVLCMAAQRDNYFAAVWPIGFKWGSNFDKSMEYSGQTYYASQDATIWTEDLNGEPYDWENWYYVISDDNILWMNCLDDPGASLLTREMQYLYRDLTGVEVPFATVDPLGDSREDQSAAIAALTAQESEIGIYWAAFEGGSHSGTWIYGHGIFGCYEWLLSQTRESEMERDKLDLDKPFETADEPVETEDRIIFTYDDGSSVYFATGKYGSGTANYNTGIYNINQKAVLRAPGALASDEPVEVEDVVIDGLVLQSVAVGKQLQLNATITPADATDQSLTWTSTNTNYATVEDGVVTGVAPGTVIITATAHNGVSYSMRVKVTAF